MYSGKKICVAVPAYNEEELITGVLDNIPAFVDFVLLVDDGSTDRTVEIAKSKGAIIASHRVNRGVGAAFRTGVKKALELKTDILVTIDGDGQFNPKDISTLIAPIIEERAGVSIASRFKDARYVPKMPLIKFLGNKFMSLVISNLSGQRFYDVSCGFRAYSQDALLRFTLFGDFTYTHETILDLTFKKVLIAEVPLKIKGVRAHGSSRVARNLVSYAYRSIKIILGAFRDYKPLRMFSLVSLPPLFLGTALGLWMLGYVIVMKSITPYKWVAFLSGFLITTSLITILVGFILDMFVRMRYIQEDILYNIKKADLTKK